MSLFHNAKKSSYQSIRAASQGASISLFPARGAYAAMFGCATACARILGDRNLTTEDKIPHYLFPKEDIYSALGRLSQHYSVALLDTACDEQGPRFVLLWKLPCTGTKAPEEASVNINDY